MRIWTISFFLIFMAFPSKAELRVYFTPSRDCENAIIEQIEKAKKIDIAVYSINNDSIIEAIRTARKRGAEIRIISDRLQASGRSSGIPKLRQSGFEVRLNRKHRIEHNKFAVFDDSMVISGSYNWTNPASERNSENCMVFDSQANEFASRFEYLWNLYGN